MPHGIEMEVALPVTLRLFHELELLGRKRELEARIGEVGCERDRIAVEDQGRLVFPPVMQDVGEIEASLGVAGILRNRSLEACAGLVRAFLAIMQVPEVNQRRDVLWVEFKGALIRCRASRSVAGSSSNSEPRSNQVTSLGWAGGSLAERQGTHQYSAATMGESV
jgi:hypothetical protein